MLSHLGQYSNEYTHHQHVKYQYRDPKDLAGIHSGQQHVYCTSEQICHEKISQKMVIQRLQQCDRRSRKQQAVGITEAQRQQDLGHEDSMGKIGFEYAESGLRRSSGALHA